MKFICYKTFFIIIIAVVIVSSCQKQDDITVNTPSIKLNGDPLGLSDAEIAEAQGILQSHIDMSWSTNDLEYSAIIDENLTLKTRTKIYQWTVLRNVFGWTILSTEKGVHKKNENNSPGLEWEWESLEHQGLSLQGYNVVVAIAPTLISANATVGKYHSVMQLYYAVNYSMFFKGFPISSSKNFTSSKIFNVNE